MKKNERRKKKKKRNEKKKKSEIKRININGDYFFFSLIPPKAFRLKNPRKVGVY